MIARGRETAPLVRVKASGDAGNGVRRQRAGKPRVGRAAVRPDAPAPQVLARVPDRLAVGGVSVVHAELRTRFAVVRLIRGDRALTHDVRIARNRNDAFAQRDRIARAVGNTAHFAPYLALPNGARTNVRARRPLLVGAARERPHAVAGAVIDVGAGRTGYGRHFAVSAVGRAQERRNLRSEPGPVRARKVPRRPVVARKGRIVKRFARPAGEFLVHGVLLHIGEQERNGAVDRAMDGSLALIKAQIVAHCARERVGVRVGVCEHRQPELLEVVGALHAARGLACGLDRRKEQSDQNTDDRDNDQKFDEGKTDASCPRPVLRMKQSVHVSLLMEKN